MHEPMTAERLTNLRLLAQSAYEPTNESMLIWLKNAPTPHDIIDLLDEIERLRARADFCHLQETALRDELERAGSERIAGQAKPV